MEIEVNHLLRFIFILLCKSRKLNFRGGAFMLCYLQNIIYYNNIYF